MIEIAIVLLLLLVNGVFAMSELAVVSSRVARLQGLSEHDERAKAALALVQNPNRFLATVQIGITLVGIFAGAYGGATLSGPLAGALARVPVIGAWSDVLALVIVVVLITYVSLVVGELVPKRIALHAPERIAMVVARPMLVLSVVAAPFVSLLGASTDAVLRLLRANATAEPPVSDDEIHALLKQGTEAGVFEPVEGRIVERLFRFADGRVADLMTPRHEIVWIDAAASEGHIRQVIATRRFSRYVVARGGLDDVVGVAHASDLLLASGGIDPATVTAALYVPESASSVDVLDRFRTTGSHVALVVDEFGGVVGIVSVTDVLVALVGFMPSAGRPEDPDIARRGDGSLLVDGAIPLDDLEEELDAIAGEGAEPRRLKRQPGYRTLGGFLASELRRVPKLGDTVEHDRWRFEIVDMDGNRVDKVLVVARVERQVDGTS